MEQTKNARGYFDTLRHMVRALRGWNYSLFFVGQGLSLIGTWMQGAALGWLIYRLTGSKLMLGLVGFAGQIFSFLVSPFAGVLTDRWNRHRMLIAMQALSMLQAVLLAAVAFRAHVDVWHIVALVTFLGLVNAVDIPNRQAFVADLVERREDLPNAIALNSFAFNGARLVGPALAGVVIFLSSEGACFVINAVSYLAVIGALLAMRITPRPQRPRRHLLHDLKEGFLYSFGFPPIRYVLLNLALMGLVAMPYAVLIPVFARDILKGDAVTQGLLISAAGVGAIVGALFLASRKSVLGLGRLVAAAPALLGAGLIAFSLSRFLWLSLPMLMVVGFAQMVQMAGSNTILQTIVDDDKRGRVMSFYTIAFMGTTPFGNLAAGALAQRFGAPLTLICGAVICILASAAAVASLPLLRRHVRPIYVKMGLLSETPPIPLAAEDIDIRNKVSRPGSA